MSILADLMQECEYIRWDWRVTLHGEFLCYIDATTPDVVAASSKIKMVVDWDRMRLDLV